VSELGDALAAVLEERGPLPCSKLAQVVRRRKANVLAVLAADERVKRAGGTRRCSRWALSNPPWPREQMRALAASGSMSAPGLNGPGLNGRRTSKTHRSRREVPLTAAALAALELLPPRLDSPFVFAGAKRGPFDVANFRRREWGPAVEAAGIAKPARVYDLRSTFVSNALAAGLTTFEVARVAGTGVHMIEAHYRALIDTAHRAILSRLDNAAVGLGH
jgi:hypothetical protein